VNLIASIRSRFQQSLIALLVLGKKQGIFWTRAAAGSDVLKIVASART
jgi:hypothetical protein